MSDLHKVYSIKKIRKDSEIITTYIFEWKLDMKPGQFYMVWMPWIDEKPFSIWYVTDTEFHLTVAGIWPFTKKMEELKVWDRLWFRWAFWNPWGIDSWENYICVWWWVWVPPVAHATQELLKSWKKVDFIEWARTKDFLIYEEHLKKLWADLHICTDDWTAGFHGYTTQKLEELLEKYKKEWKKITKVLTCWPEIMMKFIAKICQKYEVACEVSVERYMKCGFWVCGQCCVDWEWKRACVEWPVVEWNRALSWVEFWKYHRDATWKKHNW